MKNRIIKEIGVFPLLNKSYRQDFPVGKIVLKYGEHRKANRGFGVVHILEEHKDDLTRHGLPHNEEGVILYIEMILQGGARIFSEFSAVKGAHRPMIIYSRVGTVILERTQILDEIVYSVVTAFGGVTPRGTQIGTIPKTTKAPNQ